MSSILYNDKLYGGATTALDADHVLYDNTDSGLTSSNVQDVVDELDEVIESLENPTFTEASTRANIASGESLATIFGKVKKVITDLEAVAFSGAADDVSYDNTDSGLTATNVQDAVDELNSNISSVNVSHPISGVTAYKNGKTVMLIISVPISNATPSAWKLIGNLPANLRPAAELCFLGYDNDINSAADAYPAEIKITTGGDLSVWMFNNKTSISLKTVFSYLVP